MNADMANGLPGEWQRFARFFSALGDTTRQQIILLFDPGEEICVNDIAQLFRLSRPAISHHLRVLREAELLVCEKRGKQVYYRVNYDLCADTLQTVHMFVSARVERSRSPSR